MSDWRFWICGYEHCPDPYCMSYRLLKEHTKAIHKSDEVKTRSDSWYKVKEKRDSK